MCLTPSFLLSRAGSVALAVAAVAMLAWACAHGETPMHAALNDYELSWEASTDAGTQAALEQIDTRLRGRHGMTTEQTAVGLLDLRTLRLAMIHPDRIEYAASIPKIGILLAFFQLHPEAATNLTPTVRHELGLMIKISSNEMAAKYSQDLGLRRIQEVLNQDGFYDRAHGGGLWVGKHYGRGGERIGDPVADHSHAATIRQLLRFYLMLEQGRLASPQASKTMLEIFDSPPIPHDDIKFVRGLAGRGLRIRRKSGSWENWLHDSAIVEGNGRHYVLAAMTHHPEGDAYLEELARAVDDWLVDDAKSRPAASTKTPHSKSIRPQSSGRP